MKRKYSYACTFNFLLILFLVASCSSPKQAFYFKPAPPMPKIPQKEGASDGPLYTVSNATPATLPTTVAKPQIATKTLKKKQVRKLVKQALKNLPDTTLSKSNQRAISVKANKEKLSQLRTEMKDLKNSVEVHDDDKKTVVKVKKPISSLNQTEMILLGIAALLVLIILLSLPVIGTILGVALGIAIIALAVAILTGYIEIDGF